MLKLFKAGRTCNILGCSSLHQQRAFFSRPPYYLTTRTKLFNSLIAVQNFSLWPPWSIALITVMPLVWSRQQVQLQSCKSSDWLWGRLGLPQTVGKRHLHLRYSQHHFRRPNHPGSRWPVGTSTDKDQEVRGCREITERYLHLLLSPLFAASAPQTKWCCINSTALVGTCMGCWVKS